MKNQAGVSLIELIMAILLIGVASYSLYAYLSNRQAIEKYETHQLKASVIADTFMQEVMYAPIGQHSKLPEKRSNYTLWDYQHFAFNGCYTERKGKVCRRDGEVEPSWDHYGVNINIQQDKQIVHIIVTVTRDDITVSLKGSRIL